MEKPDQTVVKRNKSGAYVFKFSEKDGKAIAAGIEGVAEVSEAVAKPRRKKKEAA